MDSYGSHCTLDFVQYCHSHKIITFCLPPHATHLLQPLDVVIFSAHKSAYRNALDKVMNSCCDKFNKIEFLHALKSIRHEAFTPQAIAKSFCQAGIHPFNP